MIVATIVDTLIVMAIAIQHNPFATRFTKPGMIPFLLRKNERLESIADTFRANGYVGQIVGPHGCGKTTLTHSLESAMRNDFSAIRRITVRSPKHVLADDFQRQVESKPNRQLLIVDGIERLPWLHRRLLLTHARRRQTGLLLTTHQPLAGIPVLYEVRPSLDILSHLARQLAPQQPIEQSVLRSVFEQNNGSIRESLMTLYNWYEAQPTPALDPP